MAAQWTKIGHRGAPREFPANTLRSFQRAIERGCAMIECDIRQAHDGVIVMAHDPAVTDADGRVYVVAEHSSDVLGNLDLGAGEGVPTLAELAEWAQGRCAIMADMKCGGEEVETRVVAALSRLPANRKVIPGASAACRARFRQIDPALPLSLTLSDADSAIVEGENLDTLLEALDTEAVTWHHTLLNAERIARLHGYNKRVYAWTVDDLPTMQRLLAEGVDGLISNRADLLQTLP